MAFNFPCPYCERPLKLMENPSHEGTLIAYCEPCGHAWHPGDRPIIPFIEMCVEWDRKHKKKR